VAEHPEKMAESGLMPTEFWPNRVSKPWQPWQQISSSTEQVNNTEMGRAHRLKKTENGAKQNSAVKTKWL
jgi:hypothetical protein